MIYPVFNPADVLEFKDYFDTIYHQQASGFDIALDPVSIPHLFSKREDIEISAFFASMFAWGRREVILRNMHRLLDCMDNTPHDFILNHSPRELIPLFDVRHRTFNPVDMAYVISSLRRIYIAYGTLELAFIHPADHTPDMYEGLIRFNHIFFPADSDFPARTRKHIATPAHGSACKRLNMFLRWMVRPDPEYQIDFGLWKTIDPSLLYCPLDVHSSTVARHYGLLNRTQNDWRAVEELTLNLRLLHPADPIRYDIALFGLGVSRSLKTEKT